MLEFPLKIDYFFLLEIKSQAFFFFFFFNPVNIATEENLFLFVKMYFYFIKKKQTFFFFFSFQESFEDNFQNHNFEAKVKKTLYMMALCLGALASFPAKI